MGRSPTRSSRNGVEWFVDHWQEMPLFSTQKELPPRVFEGIRQERLSNTAGGLAMSLRAAGTGRMVPLWRTMETIRMPVLLVVGKRDEKFLETASAMKKRIRGCLLVEVEGAGHCVHVEKPDKFADLVERFVEDRQAMVGAAE